MEHARDVVVEQHFIPKPFGTKPRVIVALAGPRRAAAAGGSAASPPARLDRHTPDGMAEAREARLPVSFIFPSLGEDVVGSGGSVPRGARGPVVDGPLANTDILLAARGRLPALAAEAVAAAAAADAALRREARI